MLGHFCMQKYRQKLDNIYGGDVKNELLDSLVRELSLNLYQNNHYLSVELTVNLSFQ